MRLSDLFLRVMLCIWIVCIFAACAGLLIATFGKTEAVRVER